MIGAGVAGCAAAIALRQQLPDLTVLLLDRKNRSAQSFTIGETLPPQTMPLLQQLGISENFVARCDLVALGTRSIWGSEQINEYPFWYSSYGHGWHIDRASFDDWLVRQAENAGATTLFGVTVSGTPEYHHGWHLTANHATAPAFTIQSSLVVDASGSSSSFCRRMGIRADKLDQLTGSFCFFQAEANDTVHGVDSFTLVESTEIGWWYSAPLPQGLWVAALMTDSDLARDENVFDEAGWSKALAHTRLTRTRFDNKKPSMPLRVKPARSQRQQQFCGQGWYAVGDAASVFDPLSSLGIFKALRHGLLVSYAIRDELQDKPNATQKYQWLLESEFRRYQHMHQQYYQLEKRFMQAPFWLRRQRQEFARHA
nr:tryptophan 7-halogenase [Nitrosomonas marina]